MKPLQVLKETCVSKSANGPNIREYLEKKAEIAIQGDSAARRRLSDAEAHLQSREWEQIESEFATISNLHLRGGKLLQASQWTDQAQRERINSCGELEMRNRLRCESQMRTSQEIEELRRICHEEAHQIRRLQREELSLRQKEVLREPHNSSKVIPCFQRGAGVFDHTVGLLLTVV